MRIDATAPAIPSGERSAAPFTRYVAIGDSFTEGMADPDPRRPDEYAGWADRLAAHLSERARMAGGDATTFGYANLAIRGRLLADIAGRQVDAALALAPDLVSIVGGGNDILRPRADVDRPTPRRPGDRPAGNGLAAGLADVGARPDPPDPEGHRRVALNALTALGFTTPDTDWDIPLPATAPGSRATAARANAVWARRHRPRFYSLTGRQSRSIDNSNDLSWDSGRIVTTWSRPVKDWAARGMES